MALDIAENCGCIFSEFGPPHRGSYISQVGLYATRCRVEGANNDVVRPAIGRRSRASRERLPLLACNSN